MKFRVTMKDLGTLQDVCREVVEEHLADIEGLDASEREQLLESRTQNLSDFADRWFEYGEYVTIELDTEAKTATVVEVGK